MGWHLSGVTRTRIRVTAVNFIKFLSEGLSQREFYSEFELTE